MGGPVRRLAAFGVLLLLAACGSRADGPLHDESFDPPAAWPRDGELVITGHNPHDVPVTLVVRIDDRGSVNYATRANPERVVAPGPFTLRLPLAGQRTGAGRPLDLAAITRLIVFTADGAPPLRLDAVDIETPPPLPDGAVGWDLGAADGAPFPGFATLAPGDPALAGIALRAIRRPSGDALLQDGIAGVQRLELPLADGRWRITLWTEDLGAWETLPHPLRRVIRVNGETALQQNPTARQWIAGRYLAGREPEALADGSPWALFGGRGGRVSADVEVRDGRLRVELDGDAPAGRYLAGLLAEPAVTAPRALDAVEALRRERFEATWTAGRPPQGSNVAALALRAVPFRHPFDAAGRDGPDPATPLAAPDSGLNLDFVAETPHDDPAPALHLEPLRRDGVELPTTLRFGHWRYRRRGVASTLLDPVADHLRGDLDGLALHAGLPRRLTLRVEVPAGTPPGRYTGRLTLRSLGASAVQSLAVEVLPVSLPPAGLPIGVYLEGAPHLDWFADTRPARDRARRCDLDTLAGLGLTGLAPPLATPDGGSDAEFLADLRRARGAGFDDELLAYAPVKRLLAQLSPAETGQRLARLQAWLAGGRLRAPVWAIADEPGHGNEAQLAEVSAALRAADPSIRLAGQLNRADQAGLLPLFDVALLNAGFGVDAGDLEAVRRAGVAPWFYNLEYPRLAAGFHLWRAGAEGYLQWHGRMPTADPFDPTDGREDDVQLLYPTAADCPPVADLDAGLLALADGIVDLRWLRWLEQRAGDGDADARALLEELRGTLPGAWAASRATTDPERLRGRIAQLAQGLQK